MSLSACSRRLSGTIRPRVPSVTPSGDRSSGLRPSYTVSSVDALLRDLLARPNAQEATTVKDPLGQRGAATPAAWRKASAYATIGRAPPRRAFQKDIDENIADTTFRRHPTGDDWVPLWRRPGLIPSCLSLRSGLHVLGQDTPPPLNSSVNWDLSPSQPLSESLASPQHTQEPHTGGPSSGPGSLLLGLFDCSALGSQGGTQAAQGQAQTAAACAPPAVSLTVLPPLSLQPPPSPPPPSLLPTAAAPPPLLLSADNNNNSTTTTTVTTTTLEPCDSQRIKEEASEETSVVYAVVPTPDTTPMYTVSSAPSVRPYPIQATPSAMNVSVGMPPASMPMPLPPPAHGIPLVPPPPVLAATSSSSHLSNLPSPSVFQTPLSSPQPPPQPQPQRQLNTCKPESPIARTRRAARTPPMRVCSTPAQHTLAVRLPEGLAPEMVTISAKKGARLAVVADLWHREDDSHYEWEVVFVPADVDMMSVRAVFEADGELMIHVRRRPAATAAAVAGGDGGFPPPLVCAR